MAAPRKENVKDLILETTETLLNTKKLSNISLAEIAKTAGISKGTLYYHYKTKNEIAFALTNRFLDDQLEQLLIWVDNPNKDTSLYRLVRYVMERNMATSGMRLQFIYDAVIGNETIRKKLLERYAQFAEIIEEKIGTRSNVLPPHYFAWLILLVSDGLLVHRTLRNDAISTEEFIQETSEIIANFQ